MSIINVNKNRLIHPEEEWNQVYNGPAAEIRSVPYAFEWGKHVLNLD